MTKWHGGKGDKPRAKSPDKWDKGWERIFNKAKKKVTKEKIDITKLKNVWEEKSTRRRNKMTDTMFAIICLVACLVTIYINEKNI